LGRGRGNAGYRVGYMKGKYRVQCWVREGEIQGTELGRGRENTGYRVG